MTENTSKKALIVRQVPSLSDNVQDVLRTLAGEHGVDSYSTRQRLLGGGLVHFGSGPAEKVEKIARLLEQAGLSTWIIRPTRPAFGPQRLRSLEIRDDQILFTTPQGTARMDQSSRTIGILADISGAVLDKQLKRLMVLNAYHGNTANAPLEDHEIRRTIFQGQPVFDLYLFDDNDQIRTIVRALPGKFDPRGLGEMASLSARGNLEALVALTENFSTNFTLHTGFGLSPLPGCQLKKEVDGRDWQQQNLKNVIRYGWLMTDLARQPQGHRPEPVATAGPTVGTAAAATILGRPELATTGILGDGPGVGDVIDAIDREIAGSQSLGQGEPEPGKPLPPPPKEFDRVRNRKLLIYNGLGVATIVAALSFIDLGRIPAAVMSFGFKSGALPGVIAAGMFWGGFNFFMLKRHVENTPTSRIRSLAMGMVEIHGRARRKYALVAPMTQTPCVYYRVRKYCRDENSPWVLKSDFDSGHVPFYIEDETGRVTVDPYRASIRAGVRQEGVPGQGSLLLGGGRTSDSDEKWVETVIHEGSFLYVLGDARLQRSERKSLRQRKIEKLRDLKLDRAAMQKYDVDGDGRIDADEWQAAGEDVEQQVLRERLAEERSAARQEDHIVIGRSKLGSQPFVIAATRSEAHLSGNYALYSGLLLAGSLLVGLWALSKALIYFRIL